MKKISILGSTGSIGTQTLEVVDEIGGIEVVALSCNSNITLFSEQIKKYKPKVVAVMREDKAMELKQSLKEMNMDVRVVSGMEGLIHISTLEDIDLLVTSVVGMIGLKPTVAAINAGIDIALANKETLVTAGSIIMDLAKEKDVAIYPVDSEHSAIYQCLQGNVHEDIAKLVLTASGGPFRGKKKEDLQKVTLADALNHPNWDMGKKITIDSATMMNKGLELIEAKWLFDMPVEDVEVVVHPQSIVHSMVCYKDHSYIAQMGHPDMRVPIQYALTYPRRVKNSFPGLDFDTLKDLTFEKPDLEAFQCLALAYRAIETGGTMPTVLNAANEEAVALFLDEKIGFLDIPALIEEAMDAHDIIKAPTLEDILDTEVWSRNYVKGRWLK